MSSISPRSKSHSQRRAKRVLKSLAAPSGGASYLGEWTNEHGETGTTKIAIIVLPDRVRVGVEVFLDKHFFAEACYQEDSLTDFATLDEALAHIHERFGLTLADFEA